MNKGRKTDRPTGSRKDELKTGTGERERRARWAGGRARLGDG